MLWDICFLLLSGIILCMPVVIWSYLATEYPEIPLSRKYFFLWVFIGALTTLPFVLWGDIWVFWYFLENIFYSQNIGDSTWFFCYISAFMTLLWLGIYIISLIFQRSKSFFIFHSWMWVMIVIVFVSMIAFLFHRFFPLQDTGMNVWFGKLAFSTLGGIFVYYLTVAFLEEAVKHLGSASIFPLRVISQYKSSILLGMSVALGFAFFENILYVFSHIRDSWINLELLLLVLFRSLFTLSLHIFATGIFLSAFFIILHNSGVYSLWKKYMLFFFLALAGIGAHMFFDIFIVFSLSFLLFFYLIFLYVLTVIVTAKQAEK